MDGLEIEEIYELIEVVTHFFETEDCYYPRKEMKALLQNSKESQEPMFLVVKSVLTGAEDSAECDSILLMYLLAELKEYRLFPLLLEFLKKDEGTLDSVFGDILTEGVPSILTTLYQGEKQELFEFIQNEMNYTWARAAAKDVVENLNVLGLVSTDERITLYEEQLKIETDPVFAHSLADSLHSNGNPSSIPIIEKAIQEDRIEFFFFEGAATYLEDFGKHDGYAKIEKNKIEKIYKRMDAVAETERWDCFRKEIAREQLRARKLAIKQIPYSKKAQIKHRKKRKK